MGTVTGVLLIALMSVVVVLLYLIKELLGEIKKSLNNLYELKGRLDYERAEQIKDIQFSVRSGLDAIKHTLDNKLDDGY
jgi:hypothetical protein